MEEEEEQDEQEQGEDREVEEEEHRVEEEQEGQEQGEDHDMEMEEEEEEEEQVPSDVRGQATEDGQEEEENSEGEATVEGEEAQQVERMGNARVWGGYRVDSRGRIVAIQSAMQLPIYCQQAKTPKATVLYATGENPRAFVSLAAELLHCQDAGGGSCASQLPGMASLLANTGSVLQPESPCPSPASTDPVDLEAWNCKDHMIHIRFLLRLVNRVTLLAQYHIGGFLRQTITRAGATTAQDRNGILVAIANAGCQQEFEQYSSTLAACGCGACTRTLHWMNGDAQGRRSTAPCRITEAKTRFARDLWANITPTFFRQCIILHSTMPPTHTLLSSSVHTSTPSPTPARMLIMKLHHAIGQLQGQGLPLPLPLSQLGMWYRFEVAVGQAVEAVDWVDGDGGYLVAAHIPGLLQFVRERTPTATWAEGMRGQLVQFRCHAHDAIELAHVYHASNKAHHLGYKALCIARGEMARASRVTIYTAGDMDIHARRLVCDVHTTNSQGITTSPGERLLQAGLSYPMPNAPANYLAAFAEAEATATGVFSHFPPNLAKSPELRPHRLRSSFSASRKAVHFTMNGNEFMVTNQSTMRHVSHALIWESREDGAGQGTFVRSRTPHQHANPFVGKKAILCGYGSRTITTREMNSLPHHELEYTLSLHGGRHYNSFR